MKIGVVQTKPIKGNIESNIQRHSRLIELALLHGADTIIFPELSITGYEHELAEKLATTPADHRFNLFQQISEREKVTIGIGVPIRQEAGICISMVLFCPNQERSVYSKHYLHADEEPFFVSGQKAEILIGDKSKAALAICYELSVPAHAQNAFNKGAETYIASVAKSVLGVETAHERLAEIARQYTMSVFMANCVGHCDDFDCGGGSAVWNYHGQLIGKLNSREEGVLIYDLDTQELWQTILQH